MPHFCKANLYKSAVFAAAKKIRIPNVPCIEWLDYHLVLFNFD